MYCQLSGQLAEEPVITKSGYIYEKSLIEKHIRSTGRDPQTDEVLTLEDLIPVKTSKAVKPRPVTATSIPSMLQLFQNEWDALMLETFTLKQHLDTVRQQLSHALYQHDAACRVIARLIKERDSAREALAHAKEEFEKRVQKGKGTEEMEVEEGGEATGITSAIVKKMTEVSQELSKNRKKRQISETLASVEDIDKYTVTSSHPTHKATQPGILCVDIDPKDSNLILTGGVDTNAVIFNRQTNKVTQTLKGHSKRVSDVLFHPTQALIFTVSHDKTGKIWKPKQSNDPESQYQVVYELAAHTDAVTACTLHSTGQYLVTASHDKTWAFYDIQNGACLVKRADPNIKEGYECASFHPDGLILGTGTSDSYVRIWDIKSQSNVATFEGHHGVITSISFSENGYYLATAAEDLCVQLWDLRTLSNFKTIQMENDMAVNAVTFDFSGIYLATAGSDLRVYNTKTFSVVKTFTDHTALVTDVAFGPDAKFLVSTSMDRNMKIYGTP